MDRCWEILQSLILQFILYTWLEITFLSANLTMSLLHLIYLYYFPKDLRIILLWKAFMIWPYPFLWPHYVLSLFYSVIHSSPRTLFNSQESHVIIITPRLPHDLPHPPNSLFPACGCLANSYLSSKTQYSIASFRKTFLTTRPRVGLFSVLLDHPLLYNRSQ